MVAPAQTFLHNGARAISDCNVVAIYNSFSAQNSIWVEEGLLSDAVGTCDTPSPPPAQAASIGTDMRPVWQPIMSHVPKGH